MTKLIPGKLYTNDGLIICLSRASVDDPSPYSALSGGHVLLYLESHQGTEVFLVDDQKYFIKSEDCTNLRYITDSSEVRSFEDNVVRHVSHTGITYMDGTTMISSDDMVVMNGTEGKIVEEE